MLQTIASDSQLLRRIKSGDELALRIIYERYWEKLYSYTVHKVGWQEVAEDIVQDIFITLWNKREEVNIEKIDAYLFASAKYKVIDFLRADLIRKRHESYSLLMKEKSSVHLEVDEEIALKELQDAMKRGIDALPEKSREIFKLNRIEHFTAKEVSLKLNIPLRTVEYHIAFAVRKLKVHLKEFMITSIIALW